MKGGDGGKSFGFIIFPGCCRAPNLPPAQGVRGERGDWEEGLMRPALPLSGQLAPISPVAAGLVRWLWLG